MHAEQDALSSTLSTVAAEEEQADDELKKAVALKPALREMVNALSGFDLGEQWAVSDQMLHGASGAETTPDAGAAGARFDVRGLRAAPTQPRGAWQERDDAWVVVPRVRPQLHPPDVSVGGRL